MHNRNEAVYVHYTVVVLIQVTKICLFNREILDVLILETTFSAIDSPDLCQISNSMPSESE